MVTSGTVSQSVLSHTPPVADSLAFRSAHLVGVCGSGMKALAELLMGLGCSVTGSDLHITSSTADVLARRGLRVHRGHNRTFVPAAAELLVYSPAVGPRNPERQMAAQRGILQLSYSQMLGRLMRDRIGISVAGTHGKSTTTAMTAWTLRHAGLSPSAVVGAELCGHSVSGWAGEGPLFVVESCEFQRSFLDLAPRHAAILAVEPDHFDCFRTFDETVAAFAAFAAKIPRGGLLLIRKECSASNAACSGLAANVQTFSLQPDADWWAADLRPTPAGTRFRIFRRGEYFAEIALRVPGEHNVLNALAAAALCEQAGATPNAICDGLHAFPGIRRRFEMIGTWRGVTLVDDYAHHPTAVKATLRTARERFAGRRIWCVFQPHQVSRTKALMHEFAESFTQADEVLVLPVFAARERVQNEPNEASRELSERIARTGVSARFSPTLDRTLTTLEDGLRSGDVLITMGAGDIGEVHHAFTRRLQRNHPPR